MRLWAALALGTIGSVGMWSYVVALPPVQADFGILRNAASLPYTMAMIGVRSVSKVTSDYLATSYSLTALIEARQHVPGGFR